MNRVLDLLISCFLQPLFIIELLYHRVSKSTNFLYNNANKYYGNQNEKITDYKNIGFCCKWNCCGTFCSLFYRPAPLSFFLFPWVIYRASAADPSPLTKKRAFLYMGNILAIAFPDLPALKSGYLLVFSVPAFALLPCQSEDPAEHEPNFCKYKRPGKFRAFHGFSKCRSLSALGGISPSVDQRESRDAHHAQRHQAYPQRRHSVVTGLRLDRRL